MLKDDRMMGMLTFVVILIAMGTLVQRADFFQRLFGPGDAAAVLNADMAEALADEPALIDVLANDSGVADPAKLAIAAPPRCGRASVRDGSIHYLGAARCVGEQTLRYGLGGELTAELRIAVKPAAGAEGEPEPDMRLVAVEPRAAAGAREGEAEAESGRGARVSAATRPTASPSARDGEAASAGVAPEPGATVPPANQGLGGQDPAVSEPPALTLAPAQAAPADARGAQPPPGDAAATARAAPSCSAPPTITLDLGPGAVTGVQVDSPCHTGEAAELAYDGLRFAIPLDRRGSGRLAVPGFRRSTEASLALGDDEPITFSLPFEGIERIDRVAVAWKARSGLALNAFEFGARPGSGGHVTPAEPRSFEAVRRQGGGWLSTYEPAMEKGQRIQVYSFWRRRAGPSGVVRLALDPGGPGEADCRGRAAGRADYVVLRSLAGRLERSRLGRVAPLDCAVLAGGPDRYLENAVDDLIVRHR